MYLNVEKFDQNTMGRKYLPVKFYITTLYFIYKITISKKFLNVYGSAIKSAKKIHSNVYIDKK